MRVSGAADIRTQLRRSVGDLPIGNAGDDDGEDGTTVPEIVRFLRVGATDTLALATSHRDIPPAALKSAGSGSDSASRRGAARRSRVRGSGDAGSPLPRMIKSTRGQPQRPGTARCCFRHAPQSQHSPAALLLLHSSACRKQPLTARRGVIDPRVTSTGVSAGGVLTCQQQAGLTVPSRSVGLPVDHSGPHRSCDRCGPLDLVPSCPDLHAPAGTREPVQLLRSPVLAHLPTSPSCTGTSLPLGGPQSGSYGFPAQRGDPSDMQSCAGRRSAAEEVCNCGAWRVDHRRETTSRSSERKSCSFASGPAAALLFRGWEEGQRAERARSPDTGLPVPTSRAQSRLSDLKSLAHHRAPSAITGQPAVQRSALQQTLRCTQALREIELSRTGVATAVSTRARCVDRPVLAVDRSARRLQIGTGEKHALTVFRELLVSASWAPRALLR